MSADVMNKQRSEDSLENPGIKEAAEIVEHRIKAAEKAIKPLSDWTGMKRSLWDRFEMWLSGKASRSHWWMKIAAWGYIPAFHKIGLKRLKSEGQYFEHHIPLKRYNQNMYGAIAGGQLLAACEMTGGDAIFQYCGGHYAMVCKNMTANFRRPAEGDVIFRITMKDDLAAKVATNGEFDIQQSIVIVESKPKPSGKHRRIGTCEITFHCIPKAHLKEKRERNKNKK